MFFIAALAHPSHTLAPLHSKVYVVGELSEGWKKKIEKTLTHVEFRSALDLVQFAPRQPVEWSAIDPTLSKHHAMPPDVRTAESWTAVLGPLETFWATHPQTLSPSDTRTQLQTLLNIVEARQALDKDVDIGLAHRIVHLVTAAPDLMSEVPPGLSSWVQEQVPEAKARRHHRVHLGAPVRWEGLPLELDEEGAAVLPPGLWDLAGVEDDAITWTSRVQVGSPVDVQRALNDMLHDQIVTPLEGDPCQAELTPVTIRWLEKKRFPYVAKGKRLWLFQDGQLRRIDRRCNR